jgi:hypothetical protein
MTKIYCADLPPSRNGGRGGSRLEFLVDKISQAWRLPLVYHDSCFFYHRNLCGRGGRVQNTYSIFTMESRFAFLNTSILVSNNMLVEKSRILVDKDIIMVEKTGMLVEKERIMVDNSNLFIYRPKLTLPCLPRKNTFSQIFTG